MTISNEFDSYWKLDTYDDVKKGVLWTQLKKQGHSWLRSSQSKAELVEIMHQYDRSFVRYDKCSNVELQEFAIAKGVLGAEWRRTDPSWSWERRWEIVRKLQTEDGSKTFHKFLDLPAELRRRVYQFYVAALPQTLKLPTKPPLSRTSRLLRQEVLPVFYAGCEFEIHLRQHPTQPSKYLEENTTQLFLLHLAPADAAYLRKIKVVINKNIDSSYSSNRANQAYLACHIDLDKKDGGFRVKMDRSPNCRKWWRPSVHQADLKNELTHLLEGLPIVQGRKRLKLQDIHSLRGLVEGVCPKF